MIMKVSSDKYLTITKCGNTYVGESNAETVTVILPRHINNIDIKDSTVWLSFVNVNNEGKTLDLTNLIKECSEDYYVAEFLMYNVFTGVEGVIQLWVEIINTEANMIAKTNIVQHMINSHKKVEESVSEQDLSVLENLSVRVEEIHEHIKSLQAHTENRLNPHDVTASQVGVYTKEEIDTALSGKAEKEHIHDCAVAEPKSGSESGKAGFMSALDKAKLDELSESLGSINTALDNIIAMQENLIGGGTV